MKVALLILGGLMAVVGFAVICRWLVRLVSFPCQFCGAKLKEFGQLPLPDRENVLAYSREHERREPDRSGLFVCTNCHTVHDDFSGEKASRDVDRFSNRTFCKACGAVIWSADPDLEFVECPESRVTVTSLPGWTCWNGVSMRTLLIRGGSPANAVTGNVVATMSITPAAIPDRIICISRILL